MISILAWVLAGVGAISPQVPFTIAATAAIVLIAATPLLRVVWLIFRWRQEGDTRFIWIASSLLLIIAIGGIAALVGK